MQEYRETRVVVNDELTKKIIFEEHEDKK